MTAPSTLSALLANPIFVLRAKKQIYARIETQIAKTAVSVAALNERDIPKMNDRVAAWDKVKVSFVNEKSIARKIKDNVENAPMLIAFLEEQSYGKSCDPDSDNRLAHRDGIIAALQQIAEYVIIADISEDEIVSYLNLHGDVV